MSAIKSKAEDCNDAVALINSNEFVQEMYALYYEGKFEEVNNITSEIKEELAKLRSDMNEIRTKVSSK